jgi:hypothetical protein
MEMTTLEGTWEEILQHAPQLAGQRLKVIVLPPYPATVEQIIFDISRDRQALENQPWLDSTTLIREDRDR